MAVRIAMRMGNEVACVAVPQDFAIIDPAQPASCSATSTLTTTPEAGGEAAIRTEIRRLHRLLLGEELADGDPELEATYQLWVTATRRWRRLGKHRPRRCALPTQAAARSRASHREDRRIRRRRTASSRRPQRHGARLDRGARVPALRRALLLAVKDGGWTMDFTRQTISCCFRCCGRDASWSTSAAPRAAGGVRRPAAVRDHRAGERRLGSDVPDRSGRGRRALHAVHRRAHQDRGADPLRAVRRTTSAMRRAVHRRRDAGGLLRQARPALARVQRRRQRDGQPRRRSARRVHGLDARRPADV